MWQDIITIAGVLMFVSFIETFIVTKIFYNSKTWIKVLSTLFMFAIFGLNIWLVNYHFPSDVTVEVAPSGKSTGYGAILLFFVGCAIFGVLLMLFAPELEKLNKKIGRINQKMGKEKIAKSQSKERKLNE